MPLTAPTGSAVTVTVANSFVPTGGSTEVTAFVSESGGTPVQNGTTVRFTTNLGRLDPVEVQTRNGYAAATFMAGDLSGVANVRATSGAIGGTAGEGENATSSNSVQITVGGAAAEAVTLSANPGSVPAGGGTVTLIAAVLDAAGNRLRNVPVTFSANAGSLSATTALTDANGEARVQLTTSRETIVTARGGAADAATVTITVNAAILLTVVPAAGGPTTTTFVFTVTPAQGGTVQSVLVDFGDGSSTDLGPISSPASVAHQYAAAGTMVVRVTQTNTDGSTSSAVVTVVVTP